LLFFHSCHFSKIVMMFRLISLVLGVIIGFTLSMDVLKKQNEVRNYDDVTIVNLPVTFFTLTQLNAVTYQSSFITLAQCDGSTAAGKYAVLTIILPSDVSLDPFGNYAVVEVSTVKDVWNSSTVIGTNYYFDENDGVITKLYSTIAWVYPSNNQVIWIRYRSYNSDVVLSLQLTYTDDAAISPGIYDKNAFKGIQTETGNYQTFSQFVISTSVINVANLNYSYFYLNFCNTVSPFGQDSSSIGIVVTTTSLPTSPMSATTVSACPKSQVSDAEYCRTSNEYAISNQCGCNVNSLQLQYTQTTVNEIYQGLYITIVGEGGSPDYQNQVTLSISTQTIS